MVLLLWSIVSCAPDAPAIAPTPDAGPRADDADVVSDAWLAVVLDRAANATYRLDPAGSTHPQLGFSANWDARGVDIEGARVDLVGWGSEEATRPAGPASWRAGDCDDTGRLDPMGACLPRLEADRGGLTEWWVGLREGFEQGFVVDEPTGDTLVLDFSGEAEVHAAHVALPGGLRYDRLAAWDADGVELAAHFEPTGDGFRIVVDTGGAAWPVTVDPVVSSAWVKYGSNYGEVVASAGDVNGDGYDDILLGVPTGNTAYLFQGTTTGPSTSAAWSLAVVSGSSQGAAVAGAGDVNADGYDDVVIGARAYDNGQTDEGRFAVYLGSATGLSTTAVLTVESDQNTAYLGSSVAGAGDVNHDGYDDVLVGAYSYDYGNTDEGKVFLYYGGASGPDSTPDWTAESNQTGAQMGWVVAGLGDVNGDGYADIGASAYTYDDGSTDEGEVFAWYGSTTGPASSPSWTYDCDQSTAYCGSSLAGGGDANGDGYDDVLVGAYYYDNGNTNEGKIWLFAGSGSGIATSSSWTTESNNSSGYLGQQGGVAFAGDVNADGYDEIVVGWYTYSSSYGELLLYNGASTWPSSTATLSFASGGSSWLLGYVVSGAGDTDGDGYDDVMAGAPGGDEVWVLYGGATGVDTTLYDWRAYGYGSSSYYGGYAVAGAGDLNGDGYDDVAFSSPYNSSSSSYYNYVYVYHGSASGLASSASTGLYVLSNTYYGRSLAGGGDTNGDGYADLLVGAYTNTNTASSEGSVYVYYGSSSGVSASNYARLDVGQASAEFGRSVAYAGDVNADGYDDVVVGAPGYDDGSSNEGEAFLFLGSAGGVDPGVDGSYDCDVASCSLGTSVAAAGDVDGDGYGDVLVGSTVYGNGQSNEGLAVLLAGTSTGWSSTPLWTYESNTASTYCGVVAGAGDVNGDGWRDLAVGCPSYSSSSGRLLVFHGSASGPSASPDLTVTGGASDLLGQAIAGLGDVDRDGDDDLAVGAPGDAPHGVATGSVWVFFGTPTGLAASADITLTEPQWETGSTAFGYSLANAGDVDADGSTNLIVGAYTAGSYGYAYLYDFDDNDGDGTIGWIDCDDANPDTWPDAEELCDGLDNDCDGAVDDETPNWWRDADGDGYGATGTAVTTCTQPTGYVGNDDDCDDGSAVVNPDATETCNSVDDDCDGSTDEIGSTGGSTFHEDADGDGYGSPSRTVDACTVPSGYVENDDDCDDAEATVWPGADEYCDDLDNDCDGTTDESTAVDAPTWYRDADGDGAGDASLTTRACDVPSGYVVAGTDCDDADATVRPTATELCDAVDNDCDGSVDEGATTRFYADADADGYGSATSFVDACSAPTGYTGNDDDCDDGTSAIRPGATETCNGTDDDCDGTTDEGVTSTFYVDGDGDGYGSSSTAQACAATSGYAAVSGDCDDADATQYPGAPEACNDLDDDCDSSVDEGVPTTAWYRDADGDGFGDSSRTVTDCAAPSGYVDNEADCDDADASFPDGRTLYRDRDGDGYGDPTESVYACFAEGYVEDGTDCDDTSAFNHPGADETWYDGVDGDCAGGSDYDQDGDGFDAESGGGDDCDDTDEAVFPGGEDRWYDGVDGDCDGASDYDSDGDGHDSATYGGDDCNDGDGAVHPGAEDAPYDGVDTDCTGAYEYDADQDGYDAADYGGDDCDDHNGTANPGGTEVWYDGIDQDCDGNDDDQDLDGVPAPEDCDDEDPSISSGCGGDDTGTPADDTGVGGGKDGGGGGGGCGCSAGPRAPVVLPLAALLLVGFRRRRSRA